MKTRRETEGNSEVFGKFRRAHEKGGAARKKEKKLHYDDADHDQGEDQVQRPQL